MPKEERRKEERDAQNFRIRRILEISESRLPRRLPSVLLPPASFSIPFFGKTVNLCHILSGPPLPVSARSRSVSTPSTLRFDFLYHARIKLDFPCTSN
jgi:hypothetical protein